MPLLVLVLGSPFGDARHITYDKHRVVIDWVQIDKARVIAHKRILGGLNWLARGSGHRVDLFGTSLIVLCCDQPCAQAFSDIFKQQAPGESAPHIAGPYLRFETLVARKAKHVAGLDLAV